MIPYNSKKALNAFTPVRVLTPKDLYARCGERRCVDKGNFTGYSRNPLERMDYAMNDVHNKVTQQEYEEYAREQAKQVQEQSNDTEPKSE